MRHAIHWKSLKKLDGKWNEKKTYEAVEVRTGRVFRGLKIIRYTEVTKDPMFGWESGGFIDPLDVSLGKFTIKESEGA